jgi:hypothetical protein
MYENKEDKMRLENSKEKQTTYININMGKFY